jgi:hypothetical protein
VDLDHNGCTLTLAAGLGVPVSVDSERVVVSADNPVRIVGQINR